MEPGQRKVAAALSLVAGALLGLAAVTQSWRSGTVEGVLLLLAIVFVSIGVSIRRGKP